MTRGYGDPIRSWRKKSPDRIALVDRRSDERLTYAELDRRSDKWVHVLQQDLGIERGDRLALLMANRRESIEIFFACIRLGVVLVPLNWRLSAQELGAIIADAQLAAMIGDSRVRPLAEDAALSSDTQMRWIDVDDDAHPLLESAPVDACSPDVSVDGEDPAMIIYTSGSTGRPKGAVLPHRQLLANALSTNAAWQLGPEDIAPITTPFFHVGGWHVFATPLWLCGGSVVLMENFDAQTFLDDIANEKCTVALAVPTQLMMLADSPRFGREIPSLKWIATGGAPCPQALRERIHDGGYSLRLGYGLTECGPNCFSLSIADDEHPHGSVGRPVPDLEMKIVDESLDEVSAGETGELLLRGPHVFSGYHNAPERTAEVMTPAGWLRTGDLARQDASGHYYICGRRKEMFISGGENVFPGEVEAALTDCPGVSEVVVVGVSDDLWGEVGRAFVVPRGDFALTGEQVLAHARSRLGKYKVPKSIVLLSDMPRLGSGKPDRRALAEMV